MVSNDFPNKLKPKTGLWMQLSNVHKSFTKYLLSIVDINLEVIRDSNHVCDSETTDLECPVMYSF